MQKHPKNGHNNNCLTMVCTQREMSWYQGQYALSKRVEFVQQGERNVSKTQNDIFQ